MLSSVINGQLINTILLKKCQYPLKEWAKITEKWAITTDTTEDRVSQNTDYEATSPALLSPDTPL